MAFLYLDPLTDRRHVPSPARLDDGRRRLLEAIPGVGILDAFAGFGLEPMPASDTRIAKVVLEVERRPEDFGRMRDAAELACLSPSRFRARFHAQLGLPFRRYRMWRRMALVMRSISHGNNLTTAAFEAGFSSSAHLSSSFKRMFGLSASELISLGVDLDLSEDQVVRPGSGVQRHDAKTGSA